MVEPALVGSERFAIGVFGVRTFGPSGDNLLKRTSDQVKARRGVIPDHARIVRLLELVYYMLCDIEPAGPVHHLDDVIVVEPRRADFGIVETVRHGQPLAPGDLPTRIVFGEGGRHRIVDVFDQAQRNGAANQSRGDRLCHRP